MAGILNVGTLGTPGGRSIDTDSIVTITDLPENTDLNNVSTTGVYGAPSIALGGSATPSLSESFTDDQIAGTDYTTIESSGTISWDSGSESLLFTNTALVGAITAYTRTGTIDGTSSLFAIEGDFNFIADNSVRKHFGFFLSTSLTAATGYRIVNIDNGFKFSSYTTGTEYVIGYFSSSTSLSTGNIYTFRVVRDSVGVFSAYINGIKLDNSVTDSTYAGPFYVGVFTYGCTVALNEIRIYSNTLNYPSDSAGVLKHTESEYGSLQEYTTFDTLKTYKRGMESGGSYSLWQVK